MMDQRRNIVAPGWRESSAGDGPWYSPFFPLDAAGRIVLPRHGNRVYSR
jgi:hypothetical protein